MQVVSIGRSSLKGEKWRFIEKSNRPQTCERTLKLKRHLVQFLTIWSLIAKGAENIHCTVGIEKCAVLLVAMALQTSLRTFHYRGAFIALFSKENKNPGLKLFIVQLGIFSKSITDAIDNN